MADSATLLEHWNRNLGRPCAGCVRVQGRPQPAFCGYCCAGCREGEERNQKQRTSTINLHFLHFYLVLMYQHHVAHLCVWQGHDAFCDALHLDQAALPVSLVVHPVTGAQRVITQGKITAPISSSSNKLT